MSKFKKIETYAALFLIAFMQEGYILKPNTNLKVFLADARNGKRLCVHTSIDSES